MRTIKEALEDGSLSLEDEIDYADMTEEEYKQEIERLKKREQECIDHYLVQCKYASKMEDKYITANNIINKAIEYLEGNIYETVEGIEGIEKFFNKRNEALLKILKGSNDNE